MEIVLLAHKPEYLSELATLHFHQWHWLNPEFTVRDYFEKGRRHLNIDTLPLTYIAIRNKRLLGSASLRTEDFDNRKDLSPWLGGMIVKESERGKGICTKLEHAICEKARELGYDSLFLFTFDKMGIYAHLGWRIIGTDEFKGNDVSIMEKALERFL